MVANVHYPSNSEHHVLLNPSRSNAAIDFPLTTDATTRGCRHAC